MDSSKAANPVNVAISDLPDVDIVFPGKYAGRIVNNRTGEVTRVLVVFRKYKGHGPVMLSAINPDQVVQR